MSAKSPTPRPPRCQLVAATGACSPQGRSTSGCSRSTGHCWTSKASNAKAAYHHLRYLRLPQARVLTRAGQTSSADGRRGHDRSELGHCQGPGRLH
eukprot:368347-Hanusia_phi.AAC.2